MNDMWELVESFLHDLGVFGVIISPRLAIDRGQTRRLADWGLRIAVEWSHEL